MDIKVERLCKQCHSNFELKAIEHNGCLRASIANFEECPDCGTRNDHWIQVNWPVEKVAPKLTYAKYEDDDHVELRANGVRIATWETGVDSTAEDQFKEFKRIFMAGYNAISTLDNKG